MGIKDLRQEIVIVNQMAIPVISTFVLESLFGLIDNAIVGRISVEGFAAVGIVSKLIYAVTGTLGMLSLAFNILFAKSFSVNCKSCETRDTFNTSITFSILLGVLFEVLCLVVGEQFLYIFYGLRGNVLEIGLDYLRISGITVGINLIIFIFSAYFKNLKITKIFMYSSIVSLAVNLFFDYTLAFGKFGFPRLGAVGTAIGSVIGLLCGIVVYMFFYEKHKIINFAFKIKSSILKRLIKLYIPLLSQDFVESTLLIMLLTSIIARIGTYATATYNLIEALNSFVLLPVYAYAGASLTLSTQAYSEGNKVKAKIYPKVASMCCFIIMIFIYCIFLAFNEEVVGLITNDIKLIDFTKKYLWMGVGIQFFNILNQIYKYCLQGIDKEKWVLYFSTIISILSCALVYVTSILFKGGIIGLYMGIGISFFTLGSGYYLYYRKL